MVHMETCVARSCSLHSLRHHNTAVTSHDNDITNTQCFLRSHRSLRRHGDNGNTCPHGDNMGMCTCHPRDPTCPVHASNPVCRCHSNACINSINCNDIKAGCPTCNNHYGYFMPDHAKLTRSLSHGAPNSLSLHSSFKRRHHGDSNRHPSHQQQQHSWSSLFVARLVAMVRPGSGDSKMGDQHCETVVAKYDYVAQGAEELNLKKNEKYKLLDDKRNWWKVRNARGESGFVPSNYMKKHKPSILTTFKNTLGRKKGGDTRSQLHSVENGDGEGLGADPGVSGRVGGGLGGSPLGGSGGGGGASDPLPLFSPFTAIARYAYTAQQSDELSLEQHEYVTVLEKSSDGWWKGRKASGDMGWFPSNYVREEDSQSGGNAGGATDLATYANPATHDSGSSGGSDLRSIQPGYLASGGGDTSGSQTSHNSRADASDVIETVRTLYAYNASGGEELSFSKGELLYILEKPSKDPEWWMARHPTGQTGLIPRNYVSTTLSKDSGLPPTPESHSDNSLRDHQLVPTPTPTLTPNIPAPTTPTTTNTTAELRPTRTLPANQTGSGSNSERGSPVKSVRAQYSVAGPFENKEWYFGHVKRAEAEQMLNKYAENGDFIVRASESNVGDYSITLKAPKKNKHFRIQYDPPPTLPETSPEATTTLEGVGGGGVFSIGQQTFENMDDLVEHYKKHPIYRHDSEKLYLVKVFVHPSDVVGGTPLPDLPESPRSSGDAVEGPTDTVPPVRLASCSLAATKCS